LYSLDCVLHVVFGKGKIESVDEEKGTYNILFKGFTKAKPIGMDYDFSKRVFEDAPSATPRNLSKPKPIDASEAASDTNAHAAHPYALPVPSEPLAVSREEEVTGSEKINASKTGKRELTLDPNETNLWKRAEVPHSGWSCEDVIDLGQPVGTCGMCGYQIIRYVHMMRHPNYHRTIGAGCVCAGNMEGDPLESEKREREFKNLQNRRSNFIKRQWKKSRKGNLYLKLMGRTLVLLPDKYREGCWSYSIDGEISPYYPSMEEAKLASFDDVIRQDVFRK